MKFRSVIFLTCAFFSTQMASAGELYFGLGVGYSSLKELNEDDVMSLETGFNGGEDLESFEQSNNDLLYKLFFGYDWSEHIGLEIGYVDYGEFDFSLEDTTPTFSRNITHRNYQKYNEKISGIYINVIPSIIYENGISLSPRVGAVAWYADGELYSESQDTYTDRPDFESSRTESYSDNGVDLLIGIGISYMKFSLIYEKLISDNDDIDSFIVSYKF